MFTGDILEAELVRIVLLQPLLDLQDGRVVVQLLAAEAQAAGRIAALHFVQYVPGHALCHADAAEAFDYVDEHVAGRGVAAGAEDVIDVDDVFFLVERDLWVALGELAEEAPVGGRFLAVEQAGLGEPEHPGSFAT
ncbi:hypothetical protein D9M71_627000 [compost metagenome]